MRPVEVGVLAQGPDAMFGQGAGLTGRAHLAGKIEQFLLHDGAHLGTRRRGGGPAVSTDPVFFGTSGDEREQIGYARIATLDLGLSHKEKHVALHAVRTFVVR